MELEIDNYRKGEVETSAKFATKAFSVQEPMSPIFTPEFFAYLWKMPSIDPDLLLCARTNGKVVGQVFVLPRKARVGKNILDVGTVAVVGTDPDYTRRGIARKLMESAIKRSREKGFSGLTLFTTPPWNAYALYEDLGFKTFFASKMHMKILDAKVLARAMGVSYLAPFMKLKAKVKEQPLPKGFTIRSYEEKDRRGCVALLNEYSKEFDYSEIISEDSFMWWQESMSKKMNPRNYVMERGSELVGAISSFTIDIIAKGTKGDMKIQLGAIGNFFYKNIYEGQIQGLLEKVLRDMKHSGFPAAFNGFSPTVFQPTELMGVIWKKYGFIQNKGIEQRFMYKSLDPKFDKLESMRSFFYQPY